jgi:hypothetical protein
VKICILMAKMRALFISPFTGALVGMKQAYTRPKANSWKQFFWNDVHAYFSPLTGAINGVRSELNKND